MATPQPVTSAGNSPTPDSYYYLYDVINPAPSDTFLGSFASVTGGELTIAMIRYKVIDQNGHVIIKSMPGQTTYSPLVIKKLVDSSLHALMALLTDAIQGKCQPKNYSISMNNPTGKALVWWHLINALPTNVSGLNFGTGDAADFVNLQFTFQAEQIIVVPPVKA